MREGWSSGQQMDYTFDRWGFEESSHDRYTYESIVDSTVWREGEMRIFRTHASVGESPDTVTRRVLRIVRWDMNGRVIEERYVDFDTDLVGLIDSTFHDSLGRRVRRRLHSPNPQLRLPATDFGLGMYPPDTPVFIDYTYDSAGRQVREKRTTRDGTKFYEEILEYDSAGRVARQGQRSRSGEILWNERRYNDHGDVIKNVWIHQDGSRSADTLSYEYDDRGNWTRMHSQPSDTTGDLGEDMTWRIVDVRRVIDYYD